jgi:RHS repeat-associated protein
VSYDGNGNLTSDTFHTYEWDADGNPTTIDTYSFNYDAFDRRVEYGNGTTWSQYLYSPSSPGAIVGTATAQTLALRVPMPGGGQAIVTSAGVNNYRRPNWQGSEVMASSPTQTILGDAAFTPFGEHYNMDLSGYDGYFAGNLSISPVFMDGYAGTWRLYHYDQGRWVSPDPAGLGAVDPTNPQSWNRYGYVMNNPLSGMDTSGMGGNCSTYSGVNSQGYWIAIYCTYYSGVIVISVPVGGPTAGAGQTGGGASGATMSSGPSSATPWYKNSCITNALGSGALNVGIDAIGLIPEAGGISRMIGHGGGYRGIVADQTGYRVVNALGKSTGFVSGLGGLLDTSPEGLISTGLAVAGFIPVAGQVASGLSVAFDIYKTAKAISQCK